jgi:hypothetical protein
MPSFRQPDAVLEGSVPPPLIAHNIFNDLGERYEKFFIESNISFDDMKMAAIASFVFFSCLAFLGWLIDTEMIEVYVQNGRDIKKGPIQQSRCPFAQQFQPRAETKFIMKRKKMAWCISLGNSFFCTLFSIIYIMNRCPKYYNLIPHFPRDRELRDTFLYGTDDFAVLVCIFFAVGNATDILIGHILYNRHLSYLTTYAHHISYMWLVYFAITSNGIFTSTTSPFAPGLVFALVEELPTFLMSLGSVFPSLRTDLGFGLTFFLFRVVFHVFWLFYMIRMKVFYQIIILCTFTLTIHLHWFFAWCKSEGKNFFPQTIVEFFGLDREDDKYE